MPDAIPTARLEEIREGWGYISNSRKWHYYESDGRSLCRKYMKLYLGDLEQGGNGSPDNCAECKRRIERRNKDADHV